MNGQQNRVVRNIIALLVNQCGTWAVTLVTTLVVLPYLGNRQWGLLAFTQAYATFFSLGMALGTGTYLTWRIARDPHVAGRLTFNTLLMQIPLTVIFIAIALLVLPHLDASSQTFQLGVLAMLVAGCAAFSSTCAAALAGLQIMRPPALIGLVSAMCGTTLMVVAMMQHRGLLVFGAIGLVTQVGTLIAFLIYTQRVIGLEPHIDVRLWRTIVIGGMPFFTWAVVLLFYGQIDIMMLKVMVGDAAVGWYSAASRIASIPVFLPTIVITAILPALSREHDYNSPRFRELASRSLRLVMAAGIPAAAGTIMVAGSLVPLLRFPASFNQMGPLIAILALNMPMIALDMVLGTILIALGRQRAWTGIGIISAFFNPLANLWAIPFTQHAFGNGAIGAASVTLATEIVMFTGALFLKPRSVFTWGDVFYIIRCLLAAGVMVPAVWALSAQFSAYSRMGALLAVGYGVVIYAMAAYMLQVITNDDLKRLIMAVLAKANVAVDVSQLSLHEMFDLVGSYLAIRGRNVSSRLAAVSVPLGVATTRVMARVGSISQPLADTARNAATRISGPISRPLRAFANGSTNPATAMVASTFDIPGAGPLERSRGGAALAVREDESRTDIPSATHLVEHDMPHSVMPVEQSSSVDQEDTLKRTAVSDERHSYGPKNGAAAGGKRQQGGTAVTDRLEPSQRGPRPQRSRPTREPVRDNGQQAKSRNQNANRAQVPIRRPH